MDEFTQKVQAPGPGVSDVVSLDYAHRERTRQRAQLASGESIGIRLPRGTIMRGGDRLATEGGRQVIVEAAPEAVSTVNVTDAETLARVAYHLGNRHVWVQVGAGWLRYAADHVLDDMVRGLGCTVASETAPFEPEAGAYHSEGHGHSGHTHEGHNHEH